MNGNETLVFATIRHQLPGRVRLKIAQKKGDSAYFNRLVKVLESCSGITQVQLNPQSASLLICHTINMPFLSIAEFAQANDLFTVTVTEPPTDMLFSMPPLPIALLASAGLNRMDESLQVLSRGRLDGRTLLIMALIGLAIRQMTRGNAMGAASSFLWYAFRLLKEENEKLFDSMDSDAGN
jgi:hypothetical protein